MSTPVDHAANLRYIAAYHTLSVHGEQLLAAAAEIDRLAGVERQYEKVRPANWKREQTRFKMFRAKNVQLKAEIDLLRKERDAVLEESLERAAKELPEWCDVSIRVERGAATVSWSDEHGNEYDIDGADQTIAEQVNAAIDAALKGKGIIYFTPALIINGIFIVHNVLDSLDNLCHDSVVGSTA